MMLLRLLRPQGIAGIAASLCLALLLVVQKGETRNWKKQSSAFERQYHEEQAAFARTVADYRAAAAAAHAADRANVARINAEQRQCPAYPLPPAALLRPPVKTDFLQKTH